MSGKTSGQDKHPNYINILCHMDYQCGTGFGNVAYNLMKHVFTKPLKKNGEYYKFNVVIAAINYHGPDYYERSNIYVINITSKDEQKDTYGRETVIKLLWDTDFDLFFALNDLQVYKEFNKALQYCKTKKREANRKVFKSILYFPIDSNPRKEWCEPLSAWDHLVTYTHWGQKLMAKQGQKRVKVIPHGNNFEDFYPIGNDQKVADFKESYFNDAKFIVTNVSRNQPRKDIPNCLIAWQEFLKNRELKKGEVLLYLHMNPHDPIGYNLVKLVDDLGIADYVKFPPDHDENKGVDLATLRLIYNASDVFLTTTLGEGWGLPVTEAMACLLPVMAPVHTSISEITQEGYLMAWPIMPDEMVPHVQPNDYERIREKPDPFFVAEHLDKAFAQLKGDLENVDGSERINDITYKAYNKVKNLYDWPNVGRKWMDFFKKMV